MKILIIGFQRSGTTLTRRVIQSHPEVKRIFHEQFLLRNFKIKVLLAYLRIRDIDPKRDNWGEKVPFYPSVKGYPITKYCELWNEHFGKQSRILHVVRHPVDVAFSVSNKYKNQNFDYALGLYQKRMVKYIPKIMVMENTFTFKYEDLLLNPDKVIPRIFWFCGLDKDVDFKSNLSIIKNPKYQNINKSRAFAYKKKTFKTDIDLTDVIRIANKIDGPEYKI
jgi:hypothetical protein